MGTHSSILAWRIPWTEEPGRLHSMGLQRVSHNWTGNTHTQTHTNIDTYLLKCSLSTNTFIYVLTTPCSMQNLGSLIRDGTHTPSAVKAWSLNH